MEFFDWRSLGEIFCSTGPCQQFLLNYFSVVKDFCFFFLVVVAGLTSFQQYFGYVTADAFAFVKVMGQEAKHAIEPATNCERFRSVTN